ncbi:MAG: membrane protein insertase YidC [Mariprofundaceae bacterium]
MDQKNMFLAFALSMAVLLGWSWLFPGPENQQPVATTQSESAAPAAQAPATTLVPPLAQASGGADNTAPQAAMLSGETFSLSNDVLDLEINDKGWITRGVLKLYKETIEPGSASVAFLNMGDKQSVYVNSGIIGGKQTQPFKLVQQANGKLTLRAELDHGRVWERQLSLAPGSYNLTITDTLKDGAGLKMYHQVVERYPDKKLSTFYEHMGPTAFLNGKLEEPDYDDLDEVGAIRKASVGGWTGIMNRYFIAAIVANPEQDYPYYFKGDGRSYQAGLMDDGVVNGKDVVFKTRMFIGPKSIPMLKTADADLERSIDYGWFAFIAKPMHSFLSWMYNYVGNYGWCIILLVLCIKILFFWPTQKSYESMAGMRKLQPEMARMKELYGDDRQRMSQEMMALYKKHKVNPLGGCLPIIIQIPVFFALYKVLLMSIEMRQAPFIGWIHDMSVQDPYFVLPVIMGLSMFVQQKLNPQPADPMQAKVMQFLPPVFTILFLFFPAGLVLYWVVNNVLSIAQQWYVLKVKQAL